MKISEIKLLEKILGQMEGLRNEIGALARKSPNDGVNKFKLRLVNATIAEATQLLGPEYLPFQDFQTFDVDDLPTNSDVTLVINQYLEEIERKRADNIVRDYGEPNRWVYHVSDGRNDIPTAPPKKINEKK